jgi:bla regulator protein BlaR1
MKRSKTILSCIALVCVFILNSTANEFKNDPQVLGEWVSVDFVTKVSDFKPGTKSFIGELFLKEFEFKADGATHKPFWTWTKGHVYHSGDKSDAQYTIKKIDENEYLFLEWMSGDVLIRKQKPKYYVLKRK